MIICEPNKFVVEVHDPMPVLLAETDFERWLKRCGQVGAAEAWPRGRSAEVAGTEAGEQLESAR
jgi:putative SOS response-associated peptidase YedK